MNELLLKVYREQLFIYVHVCISTNTSTFINRLSMSLHSRYFLGSSILFLELLEIYPHIYI